MRYFLNKTVKFPEKPRVGYFCTCMCAYIHVCVYTHLCVNLHTRKGGRKGDKRKKEAARTELIQLCLLPVTKLEVDRMTGL